MLQLAAAAVLVLFSLLVFMARGSVLAGLAAVPVSSVVSEEEGGDTGTPRLLQFPSEEKGKVRGAHASTAPGGRAGPWQLKQHFGLTMTTRPSRPQPQLMPRGENRVSRQLVLVGEMSATLLPGPWKGSYHPQSLRFCVLGAQS